MAALKPQTALGGFALITLLLTGAAVGRVMGGVSFGEALYLTGLLLVILGWLVNRLMLRCANPSEDQEA